ncbi:hypothetical protein GW17_00053305 [Ensete ventricosum]|nr:hypothetical protein GW17_00053305 [Ensete ventricosum]
MARLLVLLAVIAAVWVGAPAAVLPCERMTQMIAPCAPYLTSHAAVPGVGCCNGVRALPGIAQTHKDRVVICRCLKIVAGHFPGIDNKRAMGLPRLCGLRLNFSFSPSIDCDK